MYLYKSDRQAFEARLHQLRQNDLVVLYEELVAELKDYEFTRHLEGCSEDGIDSAAYDVVEQDEDY
ncbi:MULTISPECIES: hypothetical protein [unclassified Streptomyces]|uniref:hypothetical protein n=1 Tax=unclassified Streptomyces TaxID=2593676 RepID=UPI0009A52333|nr:hypothetical protein [Streptomyces sp. 3211]